MKDIVKHAEISSNLRQKNRNNVKPVKKTGRANKETCKKWYYDKGWKLKQDKYYKQKKEQQQIYETIILEELTNKGYFPQGWNQIDNPKQLGNTNISATPNEMKMELQIGKLKR